MLLAIPTLRPMSELDVVACFDPTNLDCETLRGETTWVVSLPFSRSRALPLGAAESQKKKTENQKNHPIWTRGPYHVLTGPALPWGKDIEPSEQTRRTAERGRKESFPKLFLFFTLFLATNEKARTFTYLSINDNTVTWL